MAGRVARLLRASARGLFSALLLSLALLLGAAPVLASYYVEPTDSPTPSPTPTRSASPTPSPTPTYSEPLPPSDDRYWEDIQDPEYTPPSPTPSASASPRHRTDRVGPSPTSGGRIDIDADSGPNEQQQDGGRDSGYYSRDAYPPGTFDGGYGLFTPNIDESPLTASPDRGTSLPPSGSRSTQPILKRLQAVDASLDQVARTLAPFPVAGLATYTAAWKPPRTANGIAEGKGAAIVANEGTPVVASANGPVTRISPDPAWGTTVELVGPDGTKYRYGRLLRVAPAIQDGMQVTRGQIIGFVGGTGSIPGGSYLWFQLAGKDDAVIAPFEYLDRWLKEALVTARVTTGLPAVDAADEVEAGLMTPEEAGIKIGPDGLPVNETDDLSPLETVLSLTFFSLLGWRGWVWLRAKRRAGKPLPVKAGVDVLPLAADAELSEDAEVPSS